MYILHSATVRIGINIGCHSSLKQAVYVLFTTVVCLCIHEQEFKCPFHINVQIYTHTETYTSLLRKLFFPYVTKCRNW